MCEVVQCRLGPRGSVLLDRAVCEHAAMSPSGGEGGEGPAGASALEWEWGSLQRGVVF